MLTRLFLNKIVILKGVLFEKIKLTSSHNNIPEYVKIFCKDALHETFSLDLLLRKSKDRWTLGGGDTVYLKIFI